MRKNISFWFRASDVVASLLSLLLFFWNAAANLWAVISFYQEQKYISMGLFLFLILSSSVLLQIFSWLWFTESSEEMNSSVEKLRKDDILVLMHVLQLGVFFRCLRMLKLSVRRFEQKPTSGAEILSYDLSTLGLFKAFSESAPQLVLMTTNVIQVQDVQLFTVAKIVASLSSLSFTVLSYHRSMCAFLADKLMMGWSSSVTYFLWNLFLIGPRVMCMSLFASVLPCYVAVHFLSLWTLMVFWAWWQKTDFMDSRAGEWLYRATVGLIWYFSWFNVASRSTKLNGMIYHVVIGVDTMLLLGLWWWWRTVESARLNPLPMNPFLLVAVLVIIYITGILLKLLYYWKFHLNKPDLEIGAAEKDENLKTEPQPPQRTAACFGMEHTDSCKTPAPPHKPATGRNLTGIQKRMKMMAENFYN
ncbi:XK-related protein 8 [Bagarius yarrelli]|uniref:XK-related protein n=1 Tax=Bagarius yarrelli TaxID=175774 RepID=A0A556TP35_BAGYA|nr:XK-related protein 8 [Bagarius yarrelli]